MIERKDERRSGGIVVDGQKIVENKLGSKASGCLGYCSCLVGLLRIAGAFETVATAAANQPAPIGSLLKLPDQERSSDPADKRNSTHGQDLKISPPR